MQSDNILCIKVLSVNAKKSGKVGVIFSLAFHVSHPNCPLLLSDFGCPKSPVLISFSWLHQTKSPALFLFSFFFVFCFLLSLLSHGSLLSLTKTKYPSLKKKLKG